MPKTEPLQRKICHQCGRTEIHPENWDKEFDICDFCANEILHQSVQEYGDLDHIDNPDEKEMVGKPINQAPFETEEMLMSKETLAHYRQEKKKDKRKEKENKIKLKTQAQPQRLIIEEPKQKFNHPDPRMNFAMAVRQTMDGSFKKMGEIMTEVRAEMEKEKKKN